jgi:integrase
MSPALKEALEIHRISCPVGPHDLVFCTKSGGPLDPDNMVKREFLPALTAAGLRRVNFHSLRHSYTSMLISQGENVKFIQSQLGHASIQTTLDRYGHLLPVDQVGVGRKLDAQLFRFSEDVRRTGEAQERRNSINQQQNESAISISNREHY